MTAPVPRRLRPCLETRCPVLTPNRYCDAHARPAWTRTQPVSRITGRKLQRLRRDLFGRSPWCVLCLAEGFYTAATIRDHVVPLAEGGPDDATNEQAICADHHAAKTAAESARGRTRAAESASHE